MQYVYNLDYHNVQYAAYGSDEELRWQRGVEIRGSLVVVYQVLFHIYRIHADSIIEKLVFVNAAGEFRQNLWQNW